jgi:hypothetical protein
LLPAIYRAFALFSEDQSSGTPERHRQPFALQPAVAGITWRPLDCSLLQGDGAMNFGRLTAVSILVACISALAAPASAQWTAKQRTEFAGDCLEACRKNPRVPEAQRPQCTDYCACVMEEGEKQLDARGFDQLMRDFAAKNNTKELQAFQGLTPACNRRAFAR